MRGLCKTQVCDASMLPGSSSSCTTCYPHSWPGSRTGSSTTHTSTHVLSLKPKMLCAVNAEHRRVVSDPSSLLLLACSPSAAEFQAQTCPICLSNIRQRRRWAQLQCQHGSCTECLWQLVKIEGLESACCLCRAALFQVKGAEGPRPASVREHEGRLCHEPGLT